MLERDVEKHFENKDRNGQFCFFAVKVRWQYVSIPVKNGADFNRPHLIQNENETKVIRANSKFELRNVHP